MNALRMQILYIPRSIPIIASHPRFIARHRYHFREVKVQVELKMKMEAGVGPASAPAAKMQEQVVPQAVFSSWEWHFFRGSCRCVYLGVSWRFCACNCIWYHVDNNIGDKTSSHADSGEL
mmetsp:Transcript_25600/g.55075  ORF Transcript_25600/g.55075 Transcript_25600/m.55075 type:complete len:120 (+) Transcript_25600:754-1113(+)